MLILGGGWQKRSQGLPTAIKIYVVKATIFKEMFN
jgi:hypothetical protein